MAHAGPPIFKAWLIFVVLANVFGFVAGAAAGFVVALLLSAVGTNAQQIPIASGIAGFIAALPISFIVFIAS